MTIKNFGLMWDRESVRWVGTRGNAGRLMGQGSIGKPIRDQLEVNFREQIGVYILYRNEIVVYVGQAGAGNSNLFSRLKNHMSDHLANRWDKFSWFGVRRVNRNGTLSQATGELNRTLKSSEVLDLLEGLLINVVEPPLNKQGAKWSGVEQYFQLPEGWSAWSERDMLIALAEAQEIDPE